MLIIAYEYESAAGRTIRKAVYCGTREEYDRVRQRIKEAEEKNLGVRLIEFDELLESGEIE